MEKFFLCTHIPIKAFNFDGTLIHSVGYNGDLDEIFLNNDIYEKTTHEIFNKKNNPVVTISCFDNIHFTACYICPNNINRGIFIIGPYTSNKVNPTGILYKPKCCIPHLISLLDDIAKSSNYVKRKQNINNMPYSLYVKKALDYIDARHSEPITLEDISKYLNINKCYFCSILKKETGKTFSQTLNEIRVYHSKRLLLETNLSILDIALSVGFNNQNYYSIVFKKLTNKTPVEFRNSERDEY
ncbi:AraC family transcriptional regulator [Gottschalkia purinilytica]|uniref:AraC family transcriptional regulator n=1 Tax=Gottschalkia purinilytica TaxID=1503 RepID=A0A0L0W769_GOTPU|nr:AraC family transcriptional regulator [Gottschalkia purinilytica]KNF07120.1 AraC family transcriptional regulator [Gottschalkia purinilytica]